MTNINLSMFFLHFSHAVSDFASEMIYSSIIDMTNINLCVRFCYTVIGIACGKLYSLIIDMTNMFASFARLATELTKNAQTHFPTLSTIETEMIEVTSSILNVA